MNIVLVHGIFSTGKVFFRMKKKLEKCGHKYFAPNLKPSDGKTGLVDLAQKLEKFIKNELGDSKKFILVGFSMGGIISRYYLQNLDGAKRVEKFFAISSPHNGTFTAYLYFGKGVKQLRPQSKFLKQLNESQDTLKEIKLFAYYTPFDLSVLPYTSSRWNIAINKKFYSLMHWFMIFNKNVIKKIISQLD